MRDMQEGVLEGAEPAAAHKRAQPAMEAETKKQRGDDEEESVRVPGGELRAPPHVACIGRPHWDQEALLPEARGEEVKVR